MNGKEIGQSRPPIPTLENQRRAVADLDTAEELVEQMSDADEQVEAAIKVSIGRALCGLPVLHAPMALLVSVDLRGQEDNFTLVNNNRTRVYEASRARHKSEVYSYLAAMLLATGNQVKCLNLLETKEADHFSWTYATMAALASVKRLTHQPFLEKAWGELRSNEPFHAGRIAFLQRRLNGSVPQEYLSRFRTDLEKRPLDSDYDRNFTNYQKLETVKLFARAGHPQEALEIWQTAYDNDHHRGFVERPMALAEISLAFALIGIDPSTHLERAAQLTDRIKVSKDFDPVWDQAQTYAKLGQAAATYNLESQNFWESALGKASQQGNNLQINSLEAIAKAQISVGFDAKATIDQAQTSLEKFFPTGKEDETIGFLEGSFPASVLKTLYWEAIFRLRLQVSDYEGAREFPGWLSTLKVDNNSKNNDYKLSRQAVALAELAYAEHLGSYDFALDDIDFTPFEL